MESYYDNYCDECLSAQPCKLFNIFTPAIADSVRGYYKLDLCPFEAAEELVYKTIESLESLVVKRRDELMNRRHEDENPLKPEVEEAVTRSFGLLSRLQFERKEYIDESGPLIIGNLIGLYLRLMTLIQELQEVE